MIHHSMSHGAISVLTVLSAEFLARQLRLSWPAMNGLISDLALWLARHVNVGLEPQVWQQGLVALLMGLTWGGAFWVITVRPATREEQG